MHSRNNIVVRGDRAFYSTSGTNWNLADEEDGVGCVELSTGQSIWFCHTQADANEIAIFGETLIVGTDKGRIFAIDAGKGVAIDSIQLPGPVFTRAIEVQSPFGNSILLISRQGEIVRYDLEQRSFVVIAKLDHQVRANPIAILPGEDCARLLVGTEEGLVLLVELREGGVESRCIFKIEEHRSSHYDFKLKIKGISSLLIADDRVIVSYIRDTADLRPPIVCFSISTGEKIWDAGRVQTASRERPDFGNSRIKPVLWKDLVLSTFSYNDSLHAFSQRTGRWVWRVRLDDGYFQNWSSPVLRENYLYVARVNGVLSVVDLNRKKVASSHSIEILSRDESDVEKSSVDFDKPWPDSDLRLGLPGPGPSQELNAGICSTPYVTNGNVLLGTVSGLLTCTEVKLPRP